MRLSPLILAVGICASFAPRVISQTTQGLITGRIVSVRTALPIDRAKVLYAGRDGTIGGEQLSDSDGYFTLPLLSPGIYHLRIEAADFQPQELAEVELAVAGRLDYNFRLRPLNDVWEAGQYNSVFLPGAKTIVAFFGPDLDNSRSGSFEATRGTETALDSSLSTVIDQQLLSNLPLNGRDIYSLLALQPGVISDTTTARGLGLAVAGQRPSASNFLLDGLENNNYLVTGPLQQLVPEAVEEYRISTNNYSAEYGRTSGFLANAITRSAAARWHALIYDNQESDVLDANGFQENASGISRAPLKQIEPGFFAGGPILRNRLFVSGLLDLDRYRTKTDPGYIVVPTTALLAETEPGGAARALLTQYAPPVSNVTQPLVELVVRPPVGIDQWLVTPRVDYLRHNGADRFMFRASVERNNQPDFMWTPYPDFVTPLATNSSSTGGSWLHSFNPRLTSEARIGVTTDLIGFNRPHPDVPLLASGDGATLPGSPAPYSFQNSGRNIELVDNLIWTQGRHLFTAGGGFLARALSGYTTAGQDGYFAFTNTADFAQDRAQQFRIARSRQYPAENATPAYDRQYRYQQYFLFAQDSFKVSPKLVVNLGLRYENFGAPMNTGSVKDALLQLGPGNDFVERIAAAKIVYPGSGGEPLYDTDNKDFAVRAGFAYSPQGNSRIVLRGGFGIFYDRPFDNLWETLQANNLVLATSNSGQNVLFQLPVAQAAAGLRTPVSAFTFSQADLLTFFQKNLRNGYAENSFLGLEQRFSDHFTAQTNFVTSLGRELLTSDIVNRPLSAQTGIDFDEANSKLPMLVYRANQGISDYYGGQAIVRYRGSNLQFQIAYTLSHSIDNQSDPLAQAFLNFNFINGNSGPPGEGPAAFTRQFDSQGDRASSDFDQRHNLAAYGVWEVPPMFTSSRAARYFRDWTVAAVAAIRSGLPYSPLATAQFNGSGQYYFNNRPDLVNGVPAEINTAGPGGIQILNPAAFTAPPFGQLGDIGRNAFHGPGLYSVDISLARRFPLEWLGEAGRLTLRADAFNVLNHANLNNPNTLFSSLSPNFGFASYGRQSSDNSGFPATTPLQETPRMIQLVVRVEF
jgi:hypothetical protein